MKLLLTLFILTNIVYANNKCGNSCTWEFNNDTKTLYIKGTGDMTNYNNSKYC